MKSLSKGVCCAESEVSSGSVHSVYPRASRCQLACRHVCSRRPSVPCSPVSRCRSCRWTSERPPWGPRHPQKSQKETTPKIAASTLKNHRSTTRPPATTTTTTSHHDNPRCIDRAAGHQLLRCAVSALLAWSVSSMRTDARAASSP